MPFFVDLCMRVNISMGLRRYFYHFFGVKTISCYTIEIIITNMTIKHLVLFGYLFLQMPNVFDSLRSNHYECLLNLRQLLP